MSKRKMSARTLVVTGLLALAACAGPIEREIGVLNEDSASLMRVAANARNAGDSRAAIPLYTRAARLSPQSADPWIELGRTFNELAAYDEATDAWSEALFLEPKNAAALAGFGASLTGLNQPALALAKYEAALAALEDPQIPVPASLDQVALRNGMGVVYDMLGDPARAQASYRAGLTIDPRDLNLANNLGLSLALSGQYEPAIEILKEAAEHPRAGAKHRLNLALAYGLAGRSEDAARVARVDLDEQLVRQNLAYYHVIRGLQGHAERVAAVGSLRHQLPPPEVAQRRVGPREVGREVGRADPPDPAATGSPPPQLAAAPAPASPTASPKPKAPSPGTALGVRAAVGSPAPAAPAVVPAAGPSDIAWRIQLGAVRQLDAAEAEWQRIQARHPTTLGDRELHLQRVALDQGTFIRIQTGPYPDQVAARAICDTLKGQEQPCIVVPPRP